MYIHLDICIKLYSVKHKIEHVWDSVQTISLNISVHLTIELHAAPTAGLRSKMISFVGPTWLLSV